VDECKPLVGGDPGRGGVPQHHRLPDRHRGRAVQVDPIEPMLKPPGTKHLKLKCDELLSSFAFKFNLRRCTVVCNTPEESIPRVITVNIYDGGNNMLTTDDARRTVTAEAYGLPPLTAGAYARPPFRLNESAFCKTGGAIGGCLEGVQGVLGFN